MRRVELIAGAYLLDCVAGDPEWFPHPVRLMGWAIEGSERLLRRPGQSSGAELLGGGVLAVGLIAVSYAAAAAAIRAAYAMGRPWGVGAELLLGWTCLAGRSLEVEARSVVGALEAGDRERARGRVARIVGRDTAGLSAEEVSRAVVETVAESLSDGVIAPMLYMAVGGVPMAMAYKAVNTLDSMIGHADERYLYFGRVAARVDDAANLLPARVTAMGIVLVASVTGWADGRSARGVGLRGAGKHRSRNAGHPEAAMAGALRVRVGGVNVYRGERIEAPRMGAEFRAPTVLAARRSLWMARAVTALAVLTTGVLTAGVLSVGRRRR